MTYTLPKLTALWILLIAMPLAAGAEAPVAIDGDALVASAVDSLARLTSLEAKVRQRASILGQLAAGNGLYAQTREAGKLLVRFEFKLQVADRSVSLLQVNDGSTLWIRRTDDDSQSQSFVNLRRVREAARPKSLAGADPASGLDAGSLPVGGLAQLLKSLADRFHFGPAVATEISGIPMWELAGEWKPEQLARIVPGRREKTAEGGSAELSLLPEHLPTSVKLTLGRDLKFPLFPYRFEYGRLQPSAEVARDPTTNRPVIRPLVTMELYEVRQRDDLPLELFAFPVGDQNVVDLTDAYLAKLGLARVAP